MSIYNTHNCVVMNHDRLCTRTMHNVNVVTINGEVELNRALVCVSLNSWCYCCCCCCCG